jgi:hypothetical protein
VLHVTPPPAAFARALRARLTRTVAAALLAALTACGGDGSGPKTGSLGITVLGLPSGATASIKVTGTGGFSRAVSSSTSLTGVPVGTYTISAPDVSSGGNTWSPTAPTITVTVAAATPASATVAYGIATGSVSINVSGLPNGVGASATLTGPAGYQHTVNASETLTNLRPGTYTLTASPVSVTEDIYQALSPSVQLNVVASLTPTATSVGYALATGRLNISLSGVPDGSAASVTVQGPAGFSRTVSQSTLLGGLTPGSYTVSATPVQKGTDTYAPPSLQQSVTVTASPAAAQVNVTYALASGRLAVTVTGLPQGVAAGITVTGPNGYSATVDASQTLTGLKKGTYVIAAGSIISGASTFLPSPATQSVEVTTTTASAAVSFGVAAATLTVNITGLPPAVNAGVVVSGPGGYGKSLTASQTLTGLAPGSYTVTAVGVTSGATTYNAAPAAQSVSLSAGGSATATVTYTAAGPAPLNLTIGGMYVTQTVQTLGRTVPLVPNKSGLLRVFVTANQTNSATPAVRARIYNGGTLVTTINIPAPGSSVPQTVVESSIGSSWNAVIPAAQLQPGYTLLVDVDPTNTVAEGSESDNQYPASGTPVSLNVQPVSTFQIRMVPVAQSANGQTGNVTTGNANSFLSWLKRLYPITTVDVDVRSTFTTSAPALVADDANGAWVQILSELNALRTTDASSRYYYGVVHTTYTSGIAGLGYVPGRAAMGWDYLPSGDEVLAHEVGHNFGRWHAPCGGAGGADPAFPYAGGSIGVYGYDLTTLSLKTPANNDIMGYCNSDWISDYTYNAVFNYRQLNPFVAAAGNQARPGLLVWGRIQKGALVLEPAFEVVAPPSFPARPGRHRLELSDARGRITSLSFDGEKVADGPYANDETFAFVIPMDALGGRTVERMTLTSARRVAELRAAPAAGRAPSAADAPQVTRTARDEVRVAWRGAGTRGVLVRDARTGDVLAFARGGSAVVRTAASEVELVVSDGVRSDRRRVTVR